MTLTMSCSFLIEILLQILKTYFTQKQSKTDRFLTSQWRKIIKNSNSVGASAHKVGKTVLVQLWPSIWTKLNNRYLTNFCLTTFKES